MGWTVGGLIPGRNRDFSLLSQCPDWLWGPPSLLHNDYEGLTTHLHLMQVIRMHIALQLYIHVPLYLHCVVLRHRDNSFTLVSTSIISFEILNAVQKYCCMGIDCWSECNE
jgi:hypothetical protein